MITNKYFLWSSAPGEKEIEPFIIHYVPNEQKTNGALLIIPGSGYAVSPSKPVQEGQRVAEYFAERGVNTFVLEYRVKPAHYSLPLLDARRAVRFIRYNSDKFGINADKICTLGYSAGGHLASTLTSYFEKFEYEGKDDIDLLDFVPNLQALCYPVINLNVDNYYVHKGSGHWLLGNDYVNLRNALNSDELPADRVPPTFLWHNFDDPGVSPVNTLRYAENLKKYNVPTEIHIFPDGSHGVGLPINDTKVEIHVRAWITAFADWLRYNDFL